MRDSKHLISIHSPPSSLSKDSPLPVMSEESVADILARTHDLCSTAVVGGLDIMSCYIEDDTAVTTLILVRNPVTGVAVVAHWETAPKHEHPLVAGLRHPAAARSPLACDEQQTEFAP